MGETTSRLTLHIGHYKTGTTALQVFLATNRALLARQGLHYGAASLRNAKHSALAYALLRDAGVTTGLHGHDDPTPAETLWQALFDEVRATPGEVLVSSEEFIRFGAHPAAVDLLRRVLAGAPDIAVRVIAYLRPPQDHLRAFVNQLVKQGAPEASLDRALRGGVEAVHLDYALALRPWIDLAGAEGVILRGYGPALRQGDALFADFLGALGYRLPLTAALPEGDPNPRLDDRLLPLIRAIHASGLPRAQTRRIAGQVAALLARTEADAPPPDLEALRERARAGIEALARLPGAGFDPAPLLADLPRPEPAPDPLAQALATVLGHELAQTRATLGKVLARLERIEAALDRPPPP